MNARIRTDERAGAPADARTRTRAWLAVAAATATLAALGVAPASASQACPGPIHESYVTLAGAPTGPAQDDYLHVLKVGRDSARQVLVLVPGLFEAAGALAPLARQIAAERPGTQVWVVDRREQDLADLSGFTKDAGSPDAAAAYYLGGHYQSASAPPPTAAESWGLATELDDLHRVVDDAREGGRQVILGGHSWGATTALAYAAWDFDGRAGYRDLSGLVLIDGGVHDAFAGEGDVYRVTTAQAQTWLKQIQAGAVWDPSLEAFGRPETFAILQQLMGTYAAAAPDAPSALAPLLPAFVRPTGPVTNLGLVNWLYVDHPLVPDLSINPAITPPATLAHALAAPSPSVYEWYWPNRLTLDLQAADPFAVTPVTQELGLRLWHARQIDVPLYSFETGLTHGTVNTSAQWVVANSRIPAAVYAGDDAMTHIDPVMAPAPANPLLTTLVPFLDGRKR